MVCELCLSKLVTKPTKHPWQFTMVALVICLKGDLRNLRRAEPEDGKRLGYQAVTKRRDCRKGIYSPWNAV